MTDPARLVLQRRSRRCAHSDDRSSVFRADGRARALALPNRSQAWRPPATRLELRLRLSPCQIRQSLAAEAFRLRHPRYRSPPAAAWLQPDDRAYTFGRRAPLLQASFGRGNQQRFTPHPRSSSGWGQAVNCLVLSGTAPIVPSGTGFSCYRGPKSTKTPVWSASCSLRNFSNLESFGFLLTEPAKSEPCGATASGLRYCHCFDPVAFAVATSASESGPTARPGRIDREREPLGPPLPSHNSSTLIRAQRPAGSEARA